MYEITEKYRKNIKQGNKHFIYSEINKTITSAVDEKPIVDVLETLLPRGKFPLVIF